MFGKYVKIPFLCLKGEFFSSLLRGQLLCTLLRGTVAAQPGTGADALQRPLRSRFRAQLTAGVRRICFSASAWTL
jgi:hypothetical protein